MGFRCATINVDKLADALGIETNELREKMRSSRSGGFARLWNFEDKGSFGTGRLSVSSRKDANSDYETQFQDGFVCFSGGAYNKAKELDIPENGVSIIILSCDVRNKWDQKTKKMYTNFYVYDFDAYGDNSSGGKPTEKQSKSASKAKKPKQEVEESADTDDTDELPF